MQELLKISDGETVLIWYDTEVDSTKDLIKAGSKNNQDVKFSHIQPGQDVAVDEF